MKTSNSNISGRSTVSVLLSLPLVLGSLLLLSQSANSSVRPNPHPLFKAGLSTELAVTKWTLTNHSRIPTSFVSNNKKSTLYPWHKAPDIIQTFASTERVLPGHGNRPYEVEQQPVSFQSALAHYWGLNELAPQDTRPMFAFDAVGFPNIVTAKTRSSAKYKPYQDLVKVVKNSSGESVALPNIRCHGYSIATTAKRARKFAKSVERYAKRYSVSPDLVNAVLTKESCFRINARSHVGAVGLMQLMPETAKWLGVKDIHDVDQNLRAGIRYLAQLKRRFGTDELALAAYNAGPGNVERYQGIPPFSETQNYVKAVKSYALRYAYSRAYNDAASS